jgi:hypothetical protein
MLMMMSRAIEMKCPWHSITTRLWEALSEWFGQLWSWFWHWFHEVLRHAYTCAWVPSGSCGMQCMRVI